VNAEPSVDSANEEDNLPLADVGMVSIPQTDLEEESMRAAVIHLWATTDDIPMAAVMVSTSQTGHRERITYSTSHRELYNLPWDETETHSVVVPESQAACMGGAVAGAYRVAEVRVLLNAISNNMDPLVASSFPGSMRAAIIANAAQNVDTILEAHIIEGLRLTTR
jgi:hypothetical protein